MPILEEAPRSGPDSEGHAIDLVGSFSAFIVPSVGKPGLSALEAARLRAVTKAAVEAESARLKALAEAEAEAAAAAESARLKAVAEAEVDAARLRAVAEAEAEAARLRAAAEAEVEAARLKAVAAAEAAVLATDASAVSMSQWEEKVAAGAPVGKAPLIGAPTVVPNIVASLPDAMSLVSLGAIHQTVNAVHPPISLGRPLSTGRREAMKSIEPLLTEVWLIMIWDVYIF